MVDFVLLGNGVKQKALKSDQLKAYYKSCTSCKAFSTQIPTKWVPRCPPVLFVVSPLSTFVRDVTKRQKEDSQTSGR